MDNFYSRVVLSVLCPHLNYDPMAISLRFSLSESKCLVSQQAANVLLIFLTIVPERENF